VKGLFTYTQARARFVEAVRAAGGGVVQSILSPSQGPSGEPLFVDVARVGPSEASRRLVLLSGVHGVEGLCGSMLQSTFLEAGRISAIAPDTAVVLIHAVNPFGFSWGRRVTEEGVDLNRNFVDFDGSLPVNPEFDAHLADLLTPNPARRHSADEELMRWFIARGATARGIVAGGQFDHPKAPFYGGRAPTWARTTLESVLRAHVAEADRLAVIDYHTGLGAKGTGQLIGSSSALPDEIAAGRAAWGASYVSPGGNGSVSYRLVGDALGAVRQLSKASVYAAAVHEFGTVSELEVMSALRDDHGAHLTGSESDVLRARAAMISAFFPSGDDWVSDVCTAAAEAVASALLWLALVDDLPEPSNAKPPTGARTNNSV